MDRAAILEKLDYFRNYMIWAFIQNPTHADSLWAFDTYLRRASIVQNERLLRSIMSEAQAKFDAFTRKS